jgi:heme-degrading monooxygenase HmoA
VVAVQASVWRFVAKAGKQGEFEQFYGPGGMWAALFHESTDFHGTILVRSRDRPREYLLMDFWKSREARDEFVKKHAAAYGALDREGEALTESEQDLGWHDDVDE